MRKPHYSFFIPSSGGREDDGNARLLRNAVYSLMPLAFDVHFEGSLINRAVPMTSTAVTDAILPNDLNAYWMPFTANRAFKQSPRLISYAKDMHYFTPDGRAIVDGTGGLWRANAGHCRAPIVEAIRTQAGELDFVPPFQFGHPKAFALANRIAALAPGDLNHVFFTEFRVGSGGYRAKTRHRLS